MRWNLLCGLGLSISGILGGLSLASAQAVTTPPAKGAAKHASQSVAVKNLRQAQKLLAEADHDYDGHRAKAAEGVHKALEEMGHKHHAKKVVAGSTPATTAAIPKAAHSGKQGEQEAQAVSDSQLGQAQHLLETSLTEITAQHPRAVAHVEKAIAEIKAALAKR
jgi:hypothetical protein